MKIFSGVALFVGLASVALMSLLTTLPADAGAQGRKGESTLLSQTWTAEPTSLFGINFGQPLSASIAECAKAVDAYGELRYVFNPLDQPCFQTAPYLKVVNVPAFPSVSVGELNGKVSSVVATRPSIYSEETFRSLVVRYGDPVQSSSEKVTTRSGAVVVRRVYRWIGSGSTLVFQSFGADLGDSILSLSTHAYDKYEAAEREKGDRSLAKSY